MSLAKHQMEKYAHLNGSDSAVALNGGYIYIYINNKELYIASVPSPNFLGERYRDTMVNNYEDFDDEEGNTYSINITSSHGGVDWELEVHPNEPEKKNELIESLELVYEENSF